MKNLKLAVLATALVASGSVMAATDGALSTTSVGTSLVTIIKENAVQITKVDDLDLGTHATLTADATDNDDVCIFNSTATYSVTATSVNGAFALNNSGEALAYTLAWSANGGPAADFTYGAPLTNLSGDRVSLDCGASTNANFSATVASADFNAASPGTYTDTVTLTVQPE